MWAALNLRHVLSAACRHVGESSDGKQCVTTALEPWLGGMALSPRAASPPAVAERGSAAAPNVSRSHFSPGLGG
jgi:hypothetical protein